MEALTFYPHCVYLHPQSFYCCMKTMQQEQEYQTINLQLNIFLAIPKIKTAILLFEM